MPSTFYPPAVPAPRPAIRLPFRFVRLCAIVLACSERYVSMNFVENFHNLFDQSFFVFLDTKMLRQTLPPGVHGVLTALCLYLPKVGVGVTGGGKG